MQRLTGESDKLAVARNIVTWTHQPYAPPQCRHAESTIKILSNENSMLTDKEDVKLRFFLGYLACITTDITIRPTSFCTATRTLSTRL